ncbi:MAG: hypothetical protein AAF850_09280 [Pseudomonadota bacterium]
MVAAAKTALDTYGYAESLIQPYAGVPDILDRFETALARYFNADAAIAFFSTARVGGWGTGECELVTAGTCLMAAKPPSENTLLIGGLEWLGCGPCCWFAAGTETIIRVAYPENAPRTAPSPPAIAAALRALEILEDAADQKNALQENAIRLQQGVKSSTEQNALSMEYQFDGGSEAERFFRALLGEHILAEWVNRPEGQGHTIALHASALHTNEQIDAAISALTNAAR